MKYIKDIIKYIIYFLFLPVWYFELLIPRKKNLWVFGSHSGYNYGDNARAFFEYVLLQNSKINAIWLTKSKNIYKKLCKNKIPVYMSYSFFGILLSLFAGYYIFDHKCGDINSYTSNGAKKIYLWHGMPIKKMGYYNDEYYKNKKLLFLKLKLLHFLCPCSRTENVDLLIVTSSFFIPFMSSAFTSIYGKKLSLYKIAITGLPRNDKLFKIIENKYIATCRKEYPNCRIIFYMPTFRLGLYNNIPFSPFSDFNFNITEFLKFLEEENIIFLFKPHPSDSKLPDFSINNRFHFLKGNEYDDLYEFLGEIDILATDYSSVYFDFLLTNKPIILTPFDYDDYIKIRGLFFDYNQYMTAIKAYNWVEFIEIVKQKKYYPVYDDIFNYYKDNNSCKRVFELIINRYRIIEKKMEIKCNGKKFS